MGDGNELFPSFAQTPRQNIDFANKGTQYKPNEGYYPTAIVVACTFCKIVGTVDFPQGFDFKAADSIMDGKVTKGFCMKCRSIRELRPITPKELKQHGLAILGHLHEVYKKLVVEKKGDPVSEQELLTAMQTAQGALLQKPKEDA